MQRLVNPGKRLPDKAGEPDFYEISRKYPLPQLPASAPQEQDASNLSPHMAQRQGAAQPNRYPFPPSQAGGYPYGFYQPGPYPQLPSAASTYGQPYPPQPPQQPYWPNQMPPNLYPPNPSAYGYYPYPQMMMPQGYDPQSFQQPSMYSQYYPSTPTAAAAAAAAAAYTNPASPKPPAQAQPQQLDERGQYYQSPGTLPNRAASAEANVADERKTPAQIGVKRSLEETHGGDPSTAYPPRPTASMHHLEGSSVPPHAAAARSAQEGTYNPVQYGGQPAVPAAAKPVSEGGNTATEQASRPVPKREEGGGDGINEQQLLQDFFQHF